jgi:hypothetical protein
MIGSSLTTININTFYFLQQAYIERVQQFLDDPDGCSCNDLNLLKEEYELLLDVGSNCGKPFWEIAKQESTEFEINRLKQMLNIEG